MTFELFQPAGGCELRGRGDGLRLEVGGIRHPTSASGRGSTFSPYGDVLHVATSPRALWLGTRRSVYVIGRNAFVRSDGPEHFTRALRARLADSPGGAAHLARLAAVEEIAHRPAPARATWGLAIACLVVYVLHLVVGAAVHEVGYFSSALVLDGDLWRLVTANLVHGFPKVPIHLALNLMGLLIMGTLLERGLGTARTLFVIGVSGFGSMLTSGLAGEPGVVGVSGVVFGLLGGVIWLELFCTEFLPAWWRLPRRTLWILLLANLALPLLVPVISGAAHVGGLVTGFAATALTTGRRLRPAAAPAWVRAASSAIVVLALASVLSAATAVLGERDFVASHALRLAELPGMSPDDLNNLAWIIAIDSEASLLQIEAALRLAERAAVETERREAPILDTLAEIQFLVGRPADAIATIDEAISREPDEAYYREQRRRFTGERAWDDRPPSPGPGFLPEFGPDPAPASDEEPGITV